MRPLNRTKTSVKNKELNTSKLQAGTSENSPLENRLDTLEKLITQLANHNEFLTKRIDALEKNDKKSLLNSSSCKSLTTNNTLIDSDSILVSEFSLSYPKSSQNEKHFLNEFESNEMGEWKKNIEKISEKIFSRNTSVYTSLLENKIEEVCNKFNVINTQFQLNVDNGNLIKKNVENFEKTERIITTLFSQISEMKCNNIKWQKEILASVSEFNEKISTQENSMENYEIFEKNVNNKIDVIEKQIKRMVNKEDKKESKKEQEIEDKFKIIENRQKSVIEQNQIMNEKLNDEIRKLEFSCKALWDSFTLFTSTLNEYDYHA